MNLTGEVSYKYYQDQPNCSYTAFGGDILAVPIQDQGVLQRNLAIVRTNRILDILCQGLRVGVHCLGGHGRTGYFGALLLGLAGKRLGSTETWATDPIAYLREHYCKEAVESQIQITQLAELLELPDLLKHKPREFFGSLGSLGSYYNLSGFIPHCGDCHWWASEDSVSVADAPCQLDHVFYAKSAPRCPCWIDVKRVSPAKIEWALAKFAENSTAGHYLSPIDMCSRCEYWPSDTSQCPRNKTNRSGDDPSCAQFKRRSLLPKVPTSNLRTADICGNCAYWVMPQKGVTGNLCSKTQRHKNGTSDACGMWELWGSKSPKVTTKEVEAIEHSNAEKGKVCGTCALWLGRGEGNDQGDCMEGLGERRKYQGACMTGHCSSAHVKHDNVDEYDEIERTYPEGGNRFCE